MATSFAPDGVGFGKIGWELDAILAKATSFAPDGVGFGKIDTRRSAGAGKEAVMQEHDVADLGLAAEGQRRIDFADRTMPVLQAIRASFAAEKPLAGVRIAACLHVTAETANLVR